MSVELSDTRTDLGALAKELDISPTLLYGWRRESSSKQGSSFPGNGKVILSAAEQELALLNKELRENADGARHSKKGYQHFLQGRQQVFGFIRDHSGIFLVGKNVFGI